MAILVTCPCGKSVRVQNEIGGKYIKCSGCGEAVNVPAPSTDLRDATAATAPRRKRKRAGPTATASTGPSPWPWIAGLAVASIILVAGLAVALMLALSGPAPANSSADQLASGPDSSNSTPDAGRTAKPGLEKPIPKAADKPPQKEPDKPKADQPPEKGPDKPKTDKPPQKAPDKPQTEKPPPEVEPAKELAEDNPEEKVATEFTEAEYALALRLFRDQESYGCMRWEPAERPEMEREWKILIFMSKSLLGKRLDKVELGSVTTNFTKAKPMFNDGNAAALLVIKLYRTNRATRREFLRRFADGIDKNQFAVQLVKTPPLVGKGVPVAGAASLTRKSLLALLGKPQAGPRQGREPKEPPRGDKGPKKKQPHPVEVYKHLPAVQRNPSRNVLITQLPNGQMQVTGIGNNSSVAAYRGPDGQLRVVPDAPGSTGLKIVVKQPRPGYTTVAGLRFRDNATISIWEDGTVEVNKTNITAWDEYKVRYVSRRVLVNGRRAIVMVQAKVRPAPKPKEEENPEERAEKIATFKLTSADSLAKEGKTAKARERYQEIIKQFPKTQAALRAKEKLEKLKK